MSGERRAHLTTREFRRLEGRKARNLTLLATAAIALSFVSVPSYGAGAVLALLLLLFAAIQRRRGYDVRRPMIAGISALAISMLSAGSCWWFFLRPAEVSGRDERRQDRVERRFDDAFERKEAPPPPRRDRENNTTRTIETETLDGGPTFVDDAGRP